MKVHQLRPNTQKKNKKRIGRGGSHGKTSGRGEKGQKSRSGRKMRPELRDFIKKIPKRRGYSAEFIETKMTTVIVGDLNVFANGTVVTPSLLAQKGMIRTRKGKLPKVKILGGGDLSKKLVLENCFVTAQAREKIINAGGEIKLV